MSMKCELFFFILDARGDLHTTTETEQLALETSSQPPKHYRHFVDDGFGHFIDKQHANEFLRHINGLTNDLQYTIEHPTPDGSIPYLDVLIHADKTTSVYRKPTFTPTTLLPHRNPQKTLLSPLSLVELTPYALPLT